MRVRLSYSVELEEVPEQVAQLIDDEWETISHCDHLVREVVDILRVEDPSMDSSLKKIDKIRQTLGSIDLRLNECQNILQGYKQAIDTPQHSDELAEDQQFYEGESE